VINDIDGVDCCPIEPKYLSVEPVTQDCQRQEVPVEITTKGGHDSIIETHFQNFVPKDEDIIIPVNKASRESPLKSDDRDYKEDQKRLVVLRSSYIP
jgi:hypothetical protein